MEIILEEKKTVCHILEICVTKKFYKPQFVKLLPSKNIVKRIKNITILLSRKS